MEYLAAFASIAFIMLLGFQIIRDGRAFESIKEKQKEFQKEITGFMGKLWEAEKFVSDSRSQMMGQKLEIENVKSDTLKLKSNLEVLTNTFHSYKSAHQADIGEAQAKLGGVLKNHRRLMLVHEYLRGQIDSYPREVSFTDKRGQKADPKTLRELTKKLREFEQ